MKDDLEFLLATFKLKKVHFSWHLLFKMMKFTPFYLTFFKKIKGQNPRRFT